MRNKKISYIIPSLKKGGAERFVVNLCNELSRKKEYEVYLISLFNNNRDESTFLCELNSDVRYISLGKRSGFSVVALIKLYVKLKKIKPDIIHTHINAFEYVLPYLIASKSCKFFHTIHSKAEKESPIKIIKQIRKFLYKREKVVPITISKDGRETYQIYYGLENDILIENGCPQAEPSGMFVDVQSRLTKNGNEFLVVHIGRIIEVKNQQLLVGAVKLFNSRYKKRIRLLIIGGVRDGKLFEELQQLAFSEPISFIGDQTNVGDYLIIADAFCLSSLYEGMPMSLIEALSVGCIPTCTAVGGITEMIEDGVNGFLSNMEVESYCEALYKNLKAVNREIIQQNCINKFKEKYSIDTCANKYERLYFKEIY